MPGESSPRVLLIQDASHAAHDLDEALRQRGVNTLCFELSRDGDSALPAQADAAILVLDRSAPAKLLEQANDALSRLKKRNISTLIWGPGGPGLQSGPPHEQLPATTSVDEIVGRLAMLARYGPALRRMEREVEQLQRVGVQLRNYFDEVERDMSLAGRLQRSFLPAAPLRLPRMNINHVYRPATWVSGDIFDVFRIDETHVGVFIADVMGHGTAAGLITMFLRRALTAKEIGLHTHRVMPPVEVLSSLHRSLANQGLPGSQFVTAIYATIDVQNLSIRMARGGHPYPLLLRRDGAVEEIQAQGGLMGVADLDPEFEEGQATLAAGDKLVFFTDGVEDILITPRPDPGDPPQITPELQRWARFGPDELVRNLVRDLDGREGSVHPPDDVTLLAIELTE